jgi:hypothetical protein
MATYRDQLIAAEPLSFENDVQLRTLLQCIPGAAQFITTGLSADLPMNNMAAMIDMLLEQGQLTYAIKTEIAKIKAGQAAVGYANRRKIDDSMIAVGSVFLDFGAISPVLTRHPKSEDDYEWYRGGIPQIPGEDMSLVGDYNGSAGLLLSTPWLADEVGQLMIRGAAQRVGTQVRWYKGSSFSGAGNRTANFVNIGEDILGKLINPQPTSQDQIFVTVGQLLTLGEDYTVAIASGVATVTFLADIPDDKTVIFRIEGTV